MPTKEISDRLEKLGMSEYAQRFAENGIDFGVLPDLTDQDLKAPAALQRITDAAGVSLILTQGRLS
jgi:hypothetical protein